MRTIPKELGFVSRLLWGAKSEEVPDLHDIEGRLPSGSSTDSTSDTQTSNQGSEGRQQSSQHSIAPSTTPNGVDVELEHTPDPYEVDFHQFPVTAKECLPIINIFQQPYHPSEVINSYLLRRVGYQYLLL